MIGDHTAIEIKATKTVSRSNLTSLRVLAEEASLKHQICVSLDDRPRREGAVEVLPDAVFLSRLWAGDFNGRRRLLPLHPRGWNWRWARLRSSRSKWV